MSLPDTIFIFVLALIVFGPKKLPEIGRQVGRLVGEFRRASNEFKFQIEEELRQAERSDNPNTIAAPVVSSDEHTEAVENHETLAASLPIGQHPNPDALLGQEAVTPAIESDQEQPETPTPSKPAAPDSISEPPLTVTAAAGTQARTTAPFAPVPEHAAAASDDFSGSNAGPVNGTSSPNNPPAQPNSVADDPAHSNAIKAELHHG